MRPDPHKRQATKRFLQKQRSKGVFISSRQFPSPSSFSSAAAVNNKNNLPSNDWRYSNTENTGDVGDDIDGETRKLQDGIRNLYIQQYHDALPLPPYATTTTSSIDRLDMQRLESKLKIIPLCTRISIPLEYHNFISSFPILDTVDRKSTLKTRKKSTFTFIPMDLPSQPDHDITANTTTINDNIQQEQATLPFTKQQLPTRMTKNTEELEEWLDDLLQ